jgi:hypothetical protein
MKTKTFLSILASIVIGLLLISGCSTTPKIKDPVNPESTLLIGRITLICTGFPHDLPLNGIHTDGITVYLFDATTDETLSMRSHGADGLFYMTEDISYDRVLYIVDFVIKTGSTRQTITMPYRLEDIPYIVLEANAVNNLGDIKWYEQYTAKGSKEYDDRGLQSTFHVAAYHEFKRNYNEVESWYKKTYPESEWNRKNWVNLEIETR